MKGKTIIIIVLIAILAYVGYMWYKNKQAQTTLGTGAAVTTTDPATGAATTSYYAANGSVLVPDDIIAWAKTITPNNQAQFFKMLPMMTAADIAGLTDLLHNQWLPGKAATPAQVTFWNTWRTTYHIDDGTISNFVGDAFSKQTKKTKTQKGARANRPYAQSRTKIKK